MITRIEAFLRTIRIFFSRSEWAIRLLRLQKLKRPVDNPGLVMVQIDGLSFTQFNRALNKRHMPFLNSLLHRERYVLHAFYSGLSSNTPAVQGEMFYGVKGCIPAFNFIDRKMGQEVKMMDASYVEQFELDLKEKGEGLLSEGSSYSNIFTGGAKESHFCWAHLGWGGVLHAVNPIVFPFLVILYIDIFIRTIALLVIEFCIALFECVRGTLKGRIFFYELRFVWLRVLVCVFLREVIVAGVCMDIMRGLPIIHMNFLGYDEQAHCRGPSSRYAHWSLQGIDSAIKRIAHVIHQSPYRHYDLWVYGDHGQETTIPYFIQYGLTIQEAVEKIFGTDGKSLQSSLSIQRKTRSTHAGLLKEKKYKNGLKAPIPSTIDFKGQKTIVTAMGPLGQVYVNKKLTAEEMLFFGEKLTTTANIPLVLAKGEGQTVVAWTRQGSYVLPQQIEEVFGKDHLFLEEFKEDVIRMCHHPDSGEFIIAGWCQGEAPISFSMEYGAHAAMGSEETKSFALLPLDTPLKNRKKNYLRAMDLREAAQRFLNKEIFSLNFVSQDHPSADKSKSICVMSYNVHGCRGSDNRVSMDRIARVIARHVPDIVCLQELDRGRMRSNSVDQTEIIARKLEMQYHFHSTYRWKDEQYGNAILSRYPMSLMKMEALPQLAAKEHYEPRGAMWVAMEIEGQKVQIINTHLSVWPTERMRQIDELLGPQWLAHPECSGAIILCGDFNALPRSSAHEKVCQKLKDSQIVQEKYRKGTWAGCLPLWQLDHIFFSSEFQLKSVSVSQTSLEKSASDHLPLIVEVRFENKKDFLLEVKENIKINSNLSEGG